MPDSNPSVENGKSLYEKLDALGEQMLTARESGDFERMDVLKDTMGETYQQIVEKNNPDGEVVSNRDAGAT